jgi:hypothetical protein
MIVVSPGHPATPAPITGRRRRRTVTYKRSQIVPFPPGLRRIDETLLANHPPPCLRLLYCSGSILDQIFFHHDPPDRGFPLAKQNIVNAMVLAQWLSPTQLDTWAELAAGSTNTGTLAEPFK